MYSAFTISNTSRNLLLARFQPKYDRVLAHHVTYEFGILKDSPPPKPAEVVLLGYATDGIGIEALIVKVDGTVEREDGRIFHITWSLDSSKYKPKDSNQMIEDCGYELTIPTTIITTPEILH